MSVVSRKLGDNLLFPQRRVYTAPEQVNYSGLPYLNPNNLNEKIYENEVPPDFELPNQKPGFNRWAVSRRPSDNLTIHMNGVPLQYKTYDLLDSREGASVFNAPIPEVHPKLRTFAEINRASYINNLKKEEISFSSPYAPTGLYPYNKNSDAVIANLISDKRSNVPILFSDISEPVGMTYKEAPNRFKSHRVTNAQALAPLNMGQEELRHFAKTGKWC